MRKLFLVPFFTFALFLFPFFTHAATPVELVSKYTNALKTGEKVKVLIVPGHDDEYWGTEYGTTREADVVVGIGQYLYDYLKKDSRLDVTISRTQMGYNPIFKNYFETNRQAITDFIAAHRQAHSVKLTTGQVQKIESVPHNSALPEVALRLYGINKWANENNIDIVIHLHINDAGGRVWGKPGKYQGVAVYIPENQFGNAPVSAVIGEAIFNELIKKNPISNYPPEAAGLLEDQDLIAIGASDTLKAASVLLEYGYIYEPQYENLEMREIYIEDLAYQTYLGLHGFFGDREKVKGKYGSPLLPHAWKKDLKKGLQNNEDVLALQIALRESGVYPASGYTKYQCTITGTFGPCTEKAVKAFQAKYKLPQTGLVGPMTRAKLNTLYSK